MFYCSITLRFRILHNCTIFVLLTKALFVLFTLVLGDEPPTNQSESRLGILAGGLGVSIKGNLKYRWKQIKPTTSKAKKTRTA